MKDLPIIDAPNATGKKFKKFFHLVESASSEDADRTRAPDVVRPRDVFGEARVLDCNLTR